jgi:hypothetical protein
MSTGRIPVSYADLGSLPRDPAALDRYLGRLHLPGHDPAPVREFTIIRDLLTSYVMPPLLTAELYLALGDIPGLTVVHHAVDVAGRTGIGFGIGAHGLFRELILDPRSYQLMGQEVVNSRADGGTLGTAILQQALVSGAGRRP